ncbi:MAG: Hint domain-containing protein [Marinibacterium sp.]
MPFLYIYSPSDFIGGLPDEANAAAAGTPTFTLTLAPGAMPTLIEVSDNDAIFDEVDGSQILASAANIDGTGYAAGTTIHTAYDLIKSGSGQRVTSVHFGGNGYQQGAVDGLVSTVPLTSGSSYRCNVERTSHQQANEYTDNFACFGQGTRIATRSGEIAVEDLTIGDLLCTADGSCKPLRLVLSQTVNEHQLRDAPGLRPVRITAGALGGGLPVRDLIVSPQHRMLVDSRIARRMFGNDEVLVTAKKLTALPGIARDRRARAVTYYHLVLDRHDVLIAEGAPSESFFAGPMALAALPASARAEIEAVFRDAATRRTPEFAARPIPGGNRQKQLVRRHARNGRPVLPQVRRADISARPSIRPA